MKLTRKWRGLKVVAMLSAGLSVWTSSEAQRLVWLGTPPDGTWSTAQDVSADGVVVGASHYPDFRLFAFVTRAFRWQNGVMEDLGTLGGRHSVAYGVSADGSVVVGTADDVHGQNRAFRWVQGQGMQNLSTLGGSRSYAYDVSADGSVVVGMSEEGSLFRAFRWTAQTGLQWLISSDIRGIKASGVSADGSVVVGEARTASSTLRAFRWVQGIGMQDLGAFGDGTSSATSVSADGSVVVGVAQDANYQYRAFRWVEGQGMQNLDTLESDESIARDVSADGAIVVGWGATAGVRRFAFRWTAARGMEDLNQTYAYLLTGGAYMAEAYAISPDGRYIVGVGFSSATAWRQEGFLLDTWRTGDTNGDGCVNNADLLAVLFAFSTPGTGYTRHEDINKDGTVDNADLLVVLFNFGQGC